MSYSSEFTSVFNLSVPTEKLPRLDYIDSIIFRDQVTLSLPNHRWQGIRESSKFNLVLDNIVHQMQIFSTSSESAEDGFKASLTQYADTPNISDIIHAMVQLEYYALKKLNNRNGVWF